MPDESKLVKQPVFTRPPKDWQGMTREEKHAWALEMIRRVKAEPAKA